MKKRSLRFDVVTVLSRAILAFVLILVAVRAQGQSTLLLSPPEVRSHDHVGRTDSSCSARE
jgi:hypothetical protein